MQKHGILLKLFFTIFITDIPQSPQSLYQDVIIVMRQ